MLTKKVGRVRFRSALQVWFLFALLVLVLIVVLVGVRRNNLSELDHIEVVRVTSGQVQVDCEVEAGDLIVLESGELVFMRAHFDLEEEDCTLIWHLEADPVVGIGMGYPSAVFQVSSVGTDVDARLHVEVCSAEQKEGKIYEFPVFIKGSRDFLRVAQPAFPESVPGEVVAALYPEVGTRQLAVVKAELGRSFRMEYAQVAAVRIPGWKFVEGEEREFFPACQVFPFGNEAAYLVGASPLAGATEIYLRSTETAETQKFFVIVN